MGKEREGHAEGEFLRRHRNLKVFYFLTGVWRIEVFIMSFSILSCA